MTNFDILNEMKLSDFVDKYCNLDRKYVNVTPSRRKYFNLCRLISCDKCPFDGCGNCFDHLIEWCDTEAPSIYENNISDEAKKIDYNTLLSAYYRCHILCIGCEKGGGCPLYDLPDMNCEDIFDYHFSKPDCTFDPRMLK